MNKKYHVLLTLAERDYLKKLTSQGTEKARTLRRAQILCLSDQGHGDSFIAGVLGCSRPTVERTRRRFVLEGLEGAINEKSRRVKERKLTPQEEAHVVALSQSIPPDGYKKWSLRLLAQTAAPMLNKESISRETIRRLLKRTNTTYCAG